MADLRASSLETLLQLVSVGQSCTLVPALAIRESWTEDRDLILRLLDQQNACCRVSMVFRKTCPRRYSLEAFAEIISENLPESVHRLGG